jgi:alanine racemase
VDINTYSTWLEIDLQAIKNNAALIREKTGAEVMAVIKANGYGHGARPAAQAAIVAELPGLAWHASKKRLPCAVGASHASC